jgi:hypothetical protein
VQHDTAAASPTESYHGVRFKTEVVERYSDEIGGLGLALLPGHYVPIFGAGGLDLIECGPGMEKRVARGAVKRRKK